MLMVNCKMSLIRDLTSFIIRVSQVRFLLGPPTVMKGSTSVHDMSPSVAPPKEISNTAALKPGLRPCPVEGHSPRQVLLLQATGTHEIQLMTEPIISVANFWGSTLDRADKPFRAIHPMKRNRGNGYK